MPLLFNGPNQVTSSFGPRTMGNSKEFHYGIDFVGQTSTVIHAVAGGKVITSTIITNRSNLTWQWGNYVCILLPDGKTRHYYCHMARRDVAAGQTLVAGAPLGRMGHPGSSFGAHTHFEARVENVKVIPTPWLGIPNQRGTYALQPGASFLVKTKNCECFAAPDLNQPAGYLQQNGKYPVVQTGELLQAGAMFGNWVLTRREQAPVWVALLPDRCELLPL